MTTCNLPAEHRPNRLLDTTLPVDPRQLPQGVQSKREVLAFHAGLKPGVPTRFTEEGDIEPAPLVRTLSGGTRHAEQCNRADLNR